VVLLRVLLLRVLQWVPGTFLALFVPRVLVLGTLEAVFVPMGVFLVMLGTI
jgi:hypothetical protein